MTSNFKFTNAVLLAPMLALLSIWAVYWAELRFGINLNTFGVFPRTLEGLRGIVFSPFIHGSVEHLYNNTIPLAVLLSSLFYFYHEVALKTLVIGFLTAGFLTWCIARPSYHIGASGIIYFLASFIFFKGIFTKYYRLVALSLAVVFLYGGLLWYLLPIEDGISWEGHLSGFIAGLLLAIFTKNVKTPIEPKYDWEHDDFNEEDDEFLKHFDDDGNFIEHTEVEDSSIKVNYEYRKDNIGNEQNNL